MDARWEHFGIFLGVDSPILRVIESDKRSKPGDCMLELVRRWTANQAGTGTRPRTWQTVVEAVKDTGDGVLAQELAQRHSIDLL